MPQNALWGLVGKVIGGSWAPLPLDPVSGSVVTTNPELPLPTGAATAALQTTINTTLGSPFQSGGLIGNTAFVANAGTNLNTSALALESGGNLGTIASAQGAGGTGITQPSGGSGLLGWLSGIYKLLSGTLTTVSSNPSTIYSGQQTLTTSAATLPSKVLVNGIVITASPTNTGTVYVGPSGVTSLSGYPLTAGQSISYAVTNLSAIYIIGTNGTDTVVFTGN